MKILVTGSEGNIGSQLVPYLQKCNHDVLCLDIVQRYRSDYILCNILNLIDAEAQIQKFKPDIIFHLAAMVSRVACEKSISTTINVNVAGTANIIQLCKRLNSKLINFSTSEIYGNQTILLKEDITPLPNNIYGISKYMAEQLVEYEAKENHLEYINLRPFMIYSENEPMGENRSAMIRFAENILKNKPIIVHKGAKRSWLHISDAINMMEKLIYIDKNLTINLGNSSVTDIDFLAKSMCIYANKSLDLIHYEELPNRMTLSKIACFDKQNEYLKYTPKICQETGLKLVIDSAKKRLNL